MGSIDLDEKDRMIVSLFERDPDVSQAEIAEKVGLSQPTVGARINKLKQMGVISTRAGMGLLKVGLKLAKVDVATKDSNGVLGQFKACPCFLNGLVVSSRENLSLFFVAGEISAIEAIVDKRLRGHPAVTGVDLGIVVTAAKDLVLPVKLSVEKGDKTPCGADCAECDYYKNNRCPGCCASKAYKGTFW